MENKKIITLDLTNCKYIMDLHERIRIAFDFPECYGANWNAFWDFLRSEVDADEVIIIGETLCLKNLKKSLNLCIGRSMKKLQYIKNIPLYMTTSDLSAIV